MIKVNDTVITPTIFPDKTSQVWKLPKELFARPKIIITWKFENEGEFLHVAQLCTLLKTTDRFVTLLLPYLPYGRQDKLVSNESTFALRTFAKLLNSLNFDEIICCDPHSDVAKNLISNFKPYVPDDAMRNAYMSTNSNRVCYPDVGALHRYDTVSDEKPRLYGKKVRDQSTGKITSYNIIGDPTGARILIIDDICDGGATFKILAKDLISQGAESVSLYVSHGIFSQGIQGLKESGIERIFTKEGEYKPDEKN